MDFKVNEEIKSKEVKVIDETGLFLGIMETSKALAKAKEKELDLVMIGGGEPPVTKFCKYKKFLYEKEKEMKEKRKNNKVICVKRLNFKVKTDKRDLTIKEKNARGFFQEGHKVTFGVRLRKKFPTDKEKALLMLSQVANDLSDVSKIEKPPASENMNALMTLSPLRMK